MRDTQSAEKDYPRYSRYASSQYNPYRQLIKKPIQAKKSEADIIQQFYSTQMLQLYQKNEKSYPNPLKILESLKQKEKKMEELERSLHQWQQKLRESQKTIKFQNKMEGTLRSFSLQGQEPLQRKIIQQEYLKIKLKFIPLLQQYLGDSNHFIKFTSTENEKLLDLLFESVDRIIKNLKGQIVTAEEKATERSLKKLQMSELRLQKQLADQTQSNKKLNERMNGYMEQCKVLGEERKKLDKQNNELHTQIVKIHQTIVQRSNLAESFREELEKTVKKYEISEKNFQQQKKKFHQAESSIKMLQQQVQELELKNKEQIRANQKLQNEISQYQKKIELDLNKNLTRVRSEENFTSLKLISETGEMKGGTNSLRVGNQIEPGKDWIDVKQRPMVETMINQWRKHLQKVVNEHARETLIKDNLIEALQNQITQLKKQIELRRQMDNQLFH